MSTTQELLAPEAKETPSLAIPDGTEYSQWLWMGRNLVTQKNHIDWLIADWVTFGRERFPEQVELALADVVDDDRHLKRLERTVRAFPPHLRHAGLSFDHHAHVASLPVQEALPLLREAGERKLSARGFRLLAMDFKVEHSHILPREEDAEDDALLALVRSWNRAPVAVRTDFAEMMRESGYGLIEFEAGRSE